METPGAVRIETIRSTKEARLLLHVLVVCNEGLFCFESVIDRRCEMAACRQFRADIEEPDDMSRTKSCEWQAFKTESRCIEWKGE